MATPPPPSTPPQSRLRTPPTPLHGPKYDSHEPYSPRRSTRINAKRDAKSSISKMHSHSPSHSPFGSVSTPQSGRKVTFHRTSSQTFSPPSSPIYPTTQATPSRTKASARLFASVGRHSRGARSSTEPESDVDAFRPTPLSQRGTKRATVAMLPTPSKTPRKQTLHPGSHLASTARVLFPGRPSNVDDAMPSPRKSKKSRSHALSLESFAEEQASGGDKIEIYTDSKERVPEAEDGEDNPFLATKRGKKSQPNGSPSAKRRSARARNGLAQELEEAVKNDEGMVYVFRGRKVFRKFDASNHSTNEDANGNSELLHQAGSTAQRPFTRSSIKPRLLFPPKDATPEHVDSDEEAMTDIEELTVEPLSASDDGKEVESLVTPVKRAFVSATLTPPTTGHRSKRNARRMTPSSSPVGPSGTDDPSPPRMRGAKSTPFDTWPRSKPGVAKSVSMKRGGEPIERPEGSTGKRSRGLGL